jgi:hypothetical protein
MVWTTNRDNSLTFGDTNGGWIGWLWKDKKRGTQIWKPKKQDLANLKALLEKYGFTVLGRIPEGIVNFLV